MSERQVLNKKNLGITEGLPLQASSGGLEELRQDIQRLMDMEAIKQLKYAYFGCVDTANLEEVATLFHEDVSVHFVGGTYEWNGSPSVIPRFFLFNTCRCSLILQPSFCLFLAGSLEIEAYCPVLSPVERGM